MNALLLAALLLPAAAQESPPADKPAYGPAITLTEARALIDRGLAEARRRKFRMAFAIVDPSGELVAFVKMDDTQFGSIRIAERKARTATRMRSSTAALEKLVLSGRTVILANDEALPLAGGVPILRDGRIIGAIGISGETAAQDDEVAQAILADPR